MLDLDAGPSWSLGGQTLLHPRSLALAHRSLPRKYIGIEICYIQINQYCVYISVLNSESMSAVNWIQVWAWLLYFISVHSCPQVSLQ